MEARTEQVIREHWGADEKPLVSVVCLTFNQAAFIRETLEGFLIQETRFPFEVIVHDDASTDGTQAIIQEYAARYPSIIKPIYQQQNQYSLGVPFITKIFASLDTPYIAICEGDDFWTDPHKLQLQVDFLERHEAYVMAFHDAYMFNEQGIIRNVQLAGLHRRDASQQELLRARYFSTLTVCFRNVIKALPPELHGVRMEDMCWWSLLGAHGKGKYMKEIRPAAYRVHKNGVLSMRPQKHRTAMSLHAYYSLARYYQRIGQQDLYEYFMTQVFSQSLIVMTHRNRIQAFLQLARKVLFKPFTNIIPSVIRK